MSQRYTAAVSSAAAVNFPSIGAHTFCGWIYADSTTSGIAAGDVLYGDTTGGGAASDSLWLGFDNTNWVFQETVSGSGAFLFSTPRTLNAWTHLAVTYDGTTVRCYVNGTLVDSAAWAHNSRAPFDHLDIGYGGDFTAQDVMAFAATLTAAQIQESMRTLAPPVGVAPYAWWQLTDAAPTADASGNGHTLSGGGDANGSQILLAATGLARASGVGASTGSASLAAGGLARASGLAAVASSASGTARRSFGFSRRGVVGAGRRHARR